MELRQLDVLFIGAGLANGLAAWLLAERRPDLRLLVLEREPMTGGRHTWSFHASDLGPDGAWIEPLVSHRWQGYEVRFPAYRRALTSGYRTIRSFVFDAKLRARLGERVRLGAEVVDVGPRFVRTAAGEVFEAKLVVDGRGLGAGAFAPCAYQKFLGLFLRTAAPHGLERPILMDACVEQRDGYRFFYVLPITATELLVEDTRYSDAPAIDAQAMRDEVLAYARAQTWGGSVDLEVVGEERGVLPIPLHGVSAPVGDGVVKSGTAGGMLHPTTGYSLPEAVVFANELAEVAGSSHAAAHLRAHASAIWSRGEFFRRLNNMFFLAARPQERRGVMEQFYQRDEKLIERFYRGKLRSGDALRIMSGKPPVPVHRGLKAFFERVALD